LRIRWRPDRLILMQRIYVWNVGDWVLDLTIDRICLLCVRGSDVIRT
jgi:hypothetical protein